MTKDTVVAFRAPEGFSPDPLTDLLRQGARDLIAQAVEAELSAFLAAHAGQTDAAGHRRLVRHGHLPEREVQTGIGAVPVKVPRVRDRAPDGAPLKFTSTPHNLQTTLTPAQEAVVVQLRRLLLLPLDDLLAVTREFLNPDVSRSGLDRCLRRHDVSNLKALLPKTPSEARKTFKTYEPGFVHVDVKYLPQMADETTRRYLFVAIDRATRWVFVRILPAKTAANARRFLRDLHRACPIRIAKILTDNEKSSPIGSSLLGHGPLRANTSSTGSAQNLVSSIG